MPKFEPGHEKRGGRKKGSGNKATVAAICAAKNCDPAEIVAELANDRKQKPELRFRCAAELLQYIHPKRRSIEQRFVDEDGNDRELLDMASVRAYMQSVDA